MDIGQPEHSQNQSQQPPQQLQPSTSSQQPPAQPPQPAQQMHVGQYIQQQPGLPYGFGGQQQQQQQLEGALQGSHVLSEQSAFANSQSGALPASATMFAGVSLGPHTFSMAPAPSEQVITAMPTCVVPDQPVGGGTSFGAGGSGMMCCGAAPTATSDLFSASFGSVRMDATSENAAKPTLPTPAPAPSVPDPFVSGFTGTGGRFVGMGGCLGGGAVDGAVCAATSIPGPLATVAPPVADPFAMDFVASATQSSEPPGRVQRESNPFQMQAIASTADDNPFAPPPSTPNPFGSPSSLQSSLPDNPFASPGSQQNAETVNPFAPPGAAPADDNPFL